MIWFLRDSRWLEPSDFLSPFDSFLQFQIILKIEAKKGGSPMDHHERRTERERIRIHAQTKHEQLKAEAIDILIVMRYTGWWRNGIV
jgi:hypothetical protein